MRPSWTTMVLMLKTWANSCFWKKKIVFKITHISNNIHLVFWKLILNNVVIKLLLCVWYWLVFFYTSLSFLLAGLNYKPYLQKVSSWYTQQFSKELWLAWPQTISMICSTNGMLHGPNKNNNAPLTVNNVRMERKADYSATQNVWHY